MIKIYFLFSASQLICRYQSTESLSNRENRLYLRLFDYLRQITFKPFFYGIEILVQRPNLFISNIGIVFSKQPFQFPIVFILNIYPVGKRTTTRNMLKEFIFECETNRTYMDLIIDFI